jgi:hypothetical protein
MKSLNWCGRSDTMKYDPMLGYVSWDLMAFWHTGICCLLMLDAMENSDSNDAALGNAYLTAPGYVLDGTGRVLQKKWHTLLAIIKSIC